MNVAQTVKKGRGASQVSARSNQPSALRSQPGLSNHRRLAGTAHGVLPRKLAIGPTNDRFEREASHIADRIVGEAKTEPVAQSSSMRTPCVEVQRKNQNASDPTPVGSSAPAAVHNVLRSAGTPLDRATRAYFEPRFGHDFSGVRIHADARAGASARSVKAHAYTVGNHVVFAPQQFSPQTASGRRLIAHEFAHVVQQCSNGPAQHGSASGVLQRAPKPSKPAPTKKFYQEALDALAAEQKQIVTIVRSQMVPDSMPVLKKLVALCEAIEGGMNKEVVKALDDFLASKTERLPLRSPSDGLVAEMAARMLALGLDAETQKLRRWSLDREKWISPVASDDFSNEIFTWERIEEQLLQQIPENGGAAGLKSLDALLLFFKQLQRERFSLNAAEIEKDWKWRAQFSDSLLIRHERTISVYASELMRLMRETFSGIQTAFQVVLDQAAEDLARGKGGAMLQNAKDRLFNQLLGLIEPKAKDQNITGEPVATTRSEFKTGCGVHFDYFAKDENAKKKRSVKIQFYDRQQVVADAAEMKSDFGGVFVARRLQIELLEEIFGLQKDAKGNLTSETKENAAAVSKLGAPGLQLHSNDDWRRFVTEKFELHEAAEGPEKALVAVIVLLEKYLRIFTTHTPYNIDDFGDNLLTKTFPRDLAGRLIHDCGVYALRVAYILSLLRDHPKLHLRFRYLVMPLHVGLIITGDSLPLFLVNNDAITRYTAADVATLRIEWNQLDETGAQAKPKQPATEARFVGEVMADSFIANVNLPYKGIEVAKSAASPAKVKAQLWNQYTKDVAPSADKLFGASVTNPKSENYQFYLKYLNVLGLLRAHYNQWIVPFWNVTAWGLWDRHQNEIKRAFTAWQNAAVDKKSAAQKAYDVAVQKYSSELRAAYLVVQDATKPITKAQEEIQAHIAKHPNVFATGIEVKSAERVRMMFYNAFGILGTEWDETVFRHLKNLHDGALIDPPFAKLEDRLLPI